MVLTPEAQEPSQAAHSRREDLTTIPAGTSRLPASLLSKLSLVNVHDAPASSDRPRGTACLATHEGTDSGKSGVGKSSVVSKRPLIEELDP